jgi:hypothetical protein
MNAFNPCDRDNSNNGIAVSHPLLTLLLCMVLVLPGLSVSAQTNQLETDQGIAASIAPYDADVRLAILQASQHPQVLTHLQKSQSETSLSFKKMIGRFSKKKQEWFYTLTRYPELMHTLATLPDNQNESTIYKLLPNQDPDLQLASWKLYHTQKKDLVQMDNINADAQQEFERTLQPLDPSTQRAFEKLSAMPDVLTLMTNNVDLTTRLGQHYLTNPTQLTNHLTALHDSLEVQNQYEVAAFKKQLADDPQAMSELSEASNAYSNANGYNSQNQQNYPNNPYYNNAPYYYGNPYSYWFGYPSWYSSPMWYPGGFGYNSGFYFGMGGYGLYGFPSYGFSNWFFNGGYYRRYPNLYRQFGNYYHGNINANRVMGSVNRGFMGVANGHYRPGGGRLNTLTSPSSYNRQGNVIRQNRGAFNGHSNANTYHTQSWGNFGGRSNAVGGGSRGSSGSRGGGGSHGGGGGRGGHR